MKRPFDYTLFLTTLLLVVLGLTMVYSASGILAQERFGGSFFFLGKEFIAVGVGLICLLGARVVPLRYLRLAPLPLFFLSLILLSLVFVPQFSANVGGVHRWLRLGPLSLQPSEIAKLALVLFMAHLLAKRQQRVGLLRGFLSPMLLAGLMIGLVLLGKDLGGGAVLGATLFLLLFVGGVRPAYLLSEILLALPALYLLIASVPYRMKRILAFLNPWDYERGAGFQIIQSYVAFHSGHLFGQGLGEGRQKLFYLPEAHTDFIFSVIGEELGLLGSLTVMTLFGIWLFRALRIAWRAPDLFTCYVALGIAFLIGLQALFNMAVVTGLLPTKGLPLPFVSYGGTSLVVSMIGVGILLNISSRSVT